MKPFDLEKALAGEPVVTRDGREVTQVTKFDLIDDVYMIHAVIYGDLESFTLNGEYSKGKESELDLFMAPKKLSGFINVYADSANIYKTKDEADEKSAYDRTACIDLSQFEKGHGL